MEKPVWRVGGGKWGLLGEMREKWSVGLVQLLFFGQLDWSNRHFCYAPLGFQCWMDMYIFVAHAGAMFL